MLHWLATLRAHRNAVKTNNLLESLVNQEALPAVTSRMRFKRSTTADLSTTQQDLLSGAGNGSVSRKTSAVSSSSSSGASSSLSTSSSTTYQERRARLRKAATGVFDLHQPGQDFRSNIDESMTVSPDDGIGKSPTEVSRESYCSKGNRNSSLTDSGLYTDSTNSSPHKSPAPNSASSTRQARIHSVVEQTSLTPLQFSPIRRYSSESEPAGGFFARRRSQPLDRVTEIEYDEQERQGEEEGHFFSAHTSDKHCQTDSQIIDDHQPTASSSSGTVIDAEKRLSFQARSSVDAAIYEDSMQCRVYNNLRIQLAESQQREQALREMLTTRDKQLVELSVKQVTQDTGSWNIEAHQQNEALSRLDSRQLKCLVVESQAKQHHWQRVAEMRKIELRDMTVWQNTMSHFGDKQKTYANSLLSETIAWKRDYVWFLQSCISAFLFDPNHRIVFSDYGEQRMKNKLTELLAEARKRNPALPSLTRTKNVEHHVDVYGFKQSYSDQMGMAHYACRQLYDFYTFQLASSDRLVARWDGLLQDSSLSSLLEEEGGQTPGKPASSVNSANTSTSSSDAKSQQLDAELKSLCRLGVPPEYRAYLWQLLIRRLLKVKIEAKGPHYFNRLLEEINENESATTHRRQISLDLLRTMPNNVQFEGPEAPGVQKLQQILQAYTIHNAALGYCQGMNFIGSVLILFLSTEDAFWGLTAILEHLMPANYFTHSLISAQVDQLVFKDILSDQLPRLALHLRSREIDISVVTLNWFLTLFYDSVPFETMLRIWDAFLVEGMKVIFRFAIALLKRNEQMLLDETETINFWKCIKGAARMAYDVEGLFHTAFNELNSFPTRLDIRVRRNYHRVVLKKEIETRSGHWKLTEDNFDLCKGDPCSIRPRYPSTFQSFIQGATWISKNKAWIYSNDDELTRIVEVDAQTCQMHHIDIELESRVNCATMLDDKTVLLGMISKKVCAYSIETRQQLWEIFVSESVSVIVYDPKESNKVFAGLCHGILTVLEQVTPEDGTDSVFRIQIGFTPIVSLLFVNNQLWCACGNNISIFNSSTVDYLQRVSISVNPLDTILSLDLGSHGIWVAVRGSSIIELWHPEEVRCLLLYNIDSKQYVGERKKEDDGTYNRQRVTALLAVDNMLWIGTGKGCINLFDLRDERDVIGNSLVVDKKASQGLLELPTGEGKRPESFVLPSSVVIDQDDEPHQTFNRQRSMRLIKRRSDSNDSAGDDANTGQRVLRRTQSALVLQVPSAIIDDLGGENDGDKNGLEEQQNPKGRAKSPMRSIERSSLDQSSPHGNDDEVFSDKSQGHSILSPTGIRPVNYAMRDVKRPSATNHFSKWHYKLGLVFRNQVAESPIRLINTNRKQSFDQHLIMSFAAYMEDLETVLKWLPANEGWMNEPIQLTDKQGKAISQYSSNSSTPKRRMRRQTSTS